MARPRGSPAGRGATSTTSRSRTSPTSLSYAAPGPRAHHAPRRLRGARAHQEASACSPPTTSILVLANPYWGDGTAPPPPTTLPLARDKVRWVGEPSPPSSPTALRSPRTSPSWWRSTTSHCRLSSTRSRRSSPSMRRAIRGLGRPTSTSTRTSSGGDLTAPSRDADHVIRRRFTDAAPYRERRWRPGASSPIGTPGRRVADPARQPPGHLLGSRRTIARVLGMPPIAVRIASRRTQVEGSGSSCPSTRRSLSVACIAIKVLDGRWK